MNYRHCYHAGNFADVLKHVILVVLLQALQRKETPFCFMDTHAGIGLYELQSIEAQKKQEYDNGIGKLFSLDAQQFPSELQTYLSIVKKYNSNQLDFYPGSPLIAENVLRSQDHMILCELHPEDVQTLKDNFKGSKNTSIHHNDAYLSMKAFLPPSVKRGLVLIDPPFEVTDEFTQIFTALQRAIKHWRGGHFMVWYPIKNKKAVDAFYKDIQSLGVEHLIVEISLNAVIDEGKLSSTGIIIINPPWQSKETIETLLPILSNTLQATCNLVHNTL
jgi:23S rRNA (adenine2030-N6)-methyltransferase